MSKLSPNTYLDLDLRVGADYMQIHGRSVISDLYAMVAQQMGAGDFLIMVGTSTPDFMVLNTDKVFGFETSVTPLLPGERGWDGRGR